MNSLIVLTSSPSIIKRNLSTFNFLPATNSDGNADI